MVREYDYKARRAYRDMQIAERYDRSRFSGILGRIKLWRDRTLVARALKQVGTVGRLLDLPCGTGRFTQILAMNAQHLICADISLEMMQVAARGFPNQMVSSIQCSVEELPFKDSCIDLTFTARFILHLPAPLRQSALCELARVSKKWVFFDCLMVDGAKAWLRWALKRGKETGGSKKRMTKEELVRMLNAAGLKLHCIFRPSWLFSEKWMILCLKQTQPNTVHVS